MNSEENDLNFNNLSKDVLLSLDFLTEIYSETDDVVLSTYINALEDRAKELKCSQQLKRVLKAFEKDRKKKNSKAVIDSSGSRAEIMNMTNFPPPYDALNCGDWIANECGIKKVYPGYEQIASYYPILPICFLKNIHTHIEKVVLAYYCSNKWSKIVVYRSDISSATAIVKLADQGLPVNINTAKPLIDYLAYIEAKNIDKIPRLMSTTKMGWHGMDFMPYTKNIIFDAATEYSSLYECITESGSYDVWLEEVKKVRASGRIEPLFFLAASFGSPLLEWLNVQSFAVNLWGESEGGKTICTRLASSVWADSREGKYWGSFLSTEAALEIKQGFLNNLPCLIDDSSNVKDKEHFNFSTFVYNRCNEKGKSRSNVKLGINFENTWRHIVLMTGEQPVINEGMQGGAINRTIELACGYTPIYSDPRRFCMMLDNNFGFAGKDFIEQIKGCGKDYVQKVFNDQLENVDKLDGMKKQSNALAVIMTADYLSEQFIFKDGVHIDLNAASEVLTDKSIVSENVRCYYYLQQMSAVNNDKFKPTVKIDRDTGEKGYRNECWGEIDNEYIYIIKPIFDRLCQEGGFSPKKFLDWAKKHDKVECDTKDSPTKAKWIKILNRNVRCVYLKLDDEDAASEQSPEYNDVSSGIPF